MLVVLRLKTDEQRVTDQGINSKRCKRLKKGGKNDNRGKDCGLAFATLAVGLM